MAEESSRPPAEDGSEEEEGEEAAEAPAREEMRRAALKKKEDERKAAIADALSVKEEEKAPVNEEKTPVREEKKVPVPEKKKAPVAEAKKAPVQKLPQIFPASPRPPLSLRPGPPGAKPHVSKSGAAARPSTTGGVNLFANDGSFLELFKKKMEASSDGSKEESKPEPDKRKPVSFVGKRRGGAKLALKTGMVAKKPKAEEEEEEVMTQKGGAWAQYMAEVKKYKAHQCSDDDKTRPLVK